MIEDAVRKADRIIIGIDPGTNIMGYGILGIYSRKPQMIAMGLIELTKLGDHYLQGVAMAAALARQVPITEYEPRKIKQAITGNGAAAKEQVCEMLVRILNIPRESLLPKLDATDALAAALCHFYESDKPVVAKGAKSWKEYIAKNPGKVKGL